jgi:hypothetical protein
MYSNPLQYPVPGQPENGITSGRGTQPSSTEAEPRRRGSRILSRASRRRPEKHTKNPPWPENHTKIADPQNHTKNGDNGLKNTLANNAYSTVLPRVLLVLQ